jgi:hypothetical protein
MVKNSPAKPIIILIWLIISNITAFLLGMQFVEYRNNHPTREWVNISLKKSSVSIEQASEHIDIWINGEKRSA